MPPFCMKCGQSATIADRFCPACGTPLAVVVQSVQPGAPTAQRPPSAILATAPGFVREGLFKSTHYLLVVTGSHLVFLGLSDPERKEAAKHPRATYSGRNPLEEIAVRPGSFAFTPGDFAKAAFNAGKRVQSNQDVPDSLEPAYLGLWIGTRRIDFYFVPGIDEAALRWALTPFLR